MEAVLAAAQHTGLSPAMSHKHCKQQDAKENAVLRRTCVQKGKWGMEGDLQIVLSFCYRILILQLSTKLHQRLIPK